MANVVVSFLGFSSRLEYGVFISRECLSLQSSAIGFHFFFLMYFFEFWNNLMIFILSITIF